MLKFILAEDVNNLSRKEVTLGDRFGTVVWENNYSKGKVISATTAYLAANAYRHEANSSYLPDLVNKNRQKIYIDEYIHSYKDVDVKQNKDKAIY
jgi:uncharacterized Rmd1/YagE family protein